MNDVKVHLPKLPTGYRWYIERDWSLYRDRLYIQKKRFFVWVEVKSGSFDKNTLHYYDVVLRTASMIIKSARLDERDDDMRDKIIRKVNDG